MITNARDILRGNAAAAAVALCITVSCLPTAHAAAQSIVVAAFTSGGRSDASGTILVLGQPFTGDAFAAPVAGRFGLVPAMLGSICHADYNADTVPDILDFLDFLQDFSDCSGLAAPCGQFGAADFNGDTIIDILDFLDFLQAFSDGC